AQFSADQLLTLGADGPWERIEARLTYNPSGSPEFTDFNIDAGPTFAYSLSSLQRSVPYLTGQNTFQGIDSNGIPGFELLRVQIGVVTNGGTCNFAASLVGSSGNTIDYINGQSTVGNLAPSYLVLDFNGPKIARSLDNGPYSIGSLS